tara:strand:+ start:574 stop:789 length:216 start_codon:yes stop_codon:yes gene_type:complete
MMRYKYKVREIIQNEQDKKDNVVDLKKAEDMEAMSLKKLKAKLDHKKEYFVEYTNKKNNFISTIMRGKEPK